MVKQVDADTLASGAVTAAKMATGVAGKIITSGVTGSFSGSTASSSFVTATTFNVTPSSTSNKILIFGEMQYWVVKILQLRHLLCS